jgi:XTP/dITP diphosphohydrolase
MKPILMATNNPGKLREAAAVLASLGMAVISMEQAGISADPDETGETFLENARIKARALAARYDGPVLADDSGLCVDALGGGPGVYSSQYGPNSKLLREMKGVTERSARFACVLLGILEDGREITAEGFCHGMIALAPKGANGFGYDPVFLLPNGKTMAELTAEEKNEVSHRGAALREFAKEWNILTGNSS